jgi:CHAT domain-containing protein
VVAEQGKFRTVALDIAPEFLDETRQAVHRFMDVSRPEAIESIWQDRAPAGLRTALAAIHDKLVKPLDLAAETKTLFIVPDERLFWVPWPALMAQQERFLFEDYIALVSPSALLLEESEPPHSVSRYLAIGSTEKIESGIIKAALSDMYLERAPASLPPLSSARQEVTDIQNAFGAGAGQGILIPPDGGSEPNLSKLLEAIATANIVHIAAHGVFNPNNPMASVIFVLPRTQAGVLRPTDFSSANLAKTSLVALSACQTGVTEVLRGGEAMGFVRGILLGGARRVLVANWIVEDRPTQEFFRAFYAQLKAGDGYATAYRNAMLDLSKRYRHPFYWAAYTMYANILN